MAHRRFSFLGAVDLLRITAQRMSKSGRRSREGRRPRLWRLLAWLGICGPHNAEFLQCRFWAARRGAFLVVAPSPPAHLFEEPAGFLLVGNKTQEDANDHPIDCGRR